MTIRCGLTLLVSFACAVPSPATPGGFRHLPAGAAQTKAPEASQGKPSGSSGSPSKKKGILHLGVNIDTNGEGSLRPTNQLT